MRIYFQIRMISMRFHVDKRIYYIYVVHILNLGQRRTWLQKTATLFSFRQYMLGQIFPLNKFCPNLIVAQPYLTEQPASGLGPSLVQDDLVPRGPPGDSALPVSLTVPPFPASFSLFKTSFAPFLGQVFPLFMFLSYKFRRVDPTSKVKEVL